jgi:hypothetical protein
MNSFSLWRAVDPLPTEIQAARAAFAGLDMRDNSLPRLVMVRRAVAASFYTDDLRGPTHAPLSVPGLTQVSSEQARIRPSSTETTRVSTALGGPDTSNGRTLV